MSCVSSFFSDARQYRYPFRPFGLCYKRQLINNWHRSSNISFLRHFLIWPRNGNTHFSSLTYWLDLGPKANQNMHLIIKENVIATKLKHWQNGEWDRDRERQRGNAWNLKSLSIDMSAKKLLSIPIGGIIHIGKSCILYYIAYKIESALQTKAKQVEKSVP